MDKKEMKQILLPGEKYKYWLGEIYYDDVQAGKLLAQALLKAHASKSSKPAAIFGLSGDYSQLSSNRELGLLQTLAKTKHLNQTVKTMWDPDVAKVKIKGLLRRYPDTNIIWSASDELALASSKVLHDYTNNALTLGGIGWLPDAITAVENGTLDATVGSHFMQAAWAIVKIFDHSKGINAFYSNKALNFKLINKGNVEEHIWLTDAQNYQHIDFKSYSLFHNPKKNRYNFTLPTEPHGTKHNN